MMMTILMKWKKMNYPRVSSLLLLLLIIIKNFFSLIFHFNSSLPLKWFFLLLLNRIYFKSTMLSTLKWLNWNWISNYNDFLNKQKKWLSCNKKKFLESNNLSISIFFLFIFKQQKQQQNKWINGNSFLVFPVL